MQPKKRNMIRFLFTIYIAVMLWLLFVRDRGGISGDYWVQIRRHLHLNVFSQIRLCIRLLQRPADHASFWWAFRNLFGNIVLFCPLGWFLPLLWPKLHRWKAILGASVAIIVMVELTQLFTWRGFCDIDDLILNTLGAILGYWLLLLAEWGWKKYGDKKFRSCSK